MDPVYVAALGLAAPGLEGWRSARRVLAGETPYVTGDVAPYRPARVPANERRRLTATMRLALQVADDAGSAGYAGAMRAVFATSGGELQTTARICEALCVSPESISPTQFHNSVQNAPAGYWAITNGSLAASTTISAFEATFAAGLLEAAVQVQVERVPVLLVAYDHPAPPPLGNVVPIRAPFAMAMVLTPDAVGSDGKVRPSVQLTIDDELAAYTLSQPSLEPLRLGNPAARCWPLLEALAQNAGRTIVIPYVGTQQLAVAVHAAVAGPAECNIALAAHAP